MIKPSFLTILSIRRVLYFQSFLLSKNPKKSIDEKFKKLQKSNKQKNTKIEGYELIEKKINNNKPVNNKNVWAIPLVFFGILGVFIVGWVQKMIIKEKK
jgi:hypothetical protein